MKGIKKFDKYLLENHPLLWYTKLPYLLMVGILTSLMSIAWGFLYGNLDALKRYSYSSWIYESYFIHFEVIILLIIIIGWAILFFKNNAFKNYYPLGNFYLFKVFMSLLLGFAVILMSFGFFYTGAKLKTDQFYTSRGFEKDIVQYYKTRQFLLINRDDYGLGENKYIRENKIRRSYFSISDRGDSTWSDLYNVFRKPVDFSKPYYSDIELNEYIPKSEDISYVDRSSCVFFTTTERYNSPDSCEKWDFVNKIHHLEGFHKYALINYSVRAHINQYAWYNTLYQSDDKMKVIASTQLENAEAANREMITRKDFGKIYKELDDLNRTFQKYKIVSHVSPHLLVQYLKCTDMHSFNSVVQGYASNYYGQDYEVYETGGVERKNQLYFLSKYDEGKIEVEEKDASTFMEYMEKSGYNYLGIDEWDHLEANYAYNYFYNKYYFWSSIYIGMAFSFLFLLFVIIDFKSILLSIPVAGILAIIIVLIGIPVTTGNYLGRSEIVILTYLLFMLMLLMGIILGGIYGTFAGRNVQKIMLVIGYVIAPSILCILAGIIYAAFSDGEGTYNKCGNYVYKSYLDDNVLLANLFNPWMVVLYLLTGYFFYLFVVKRWKSNPE